MTQRITTSSAVTAFALGLVLTWLAARAAFPIIEPIDNMRIPLLEKENALPHVAVVASPLLCWWICWAAAALRRNGAAVTRGLVGGALYAWLAAAATGLYALWSSGPA